MIDFSISPELEATRQRTTAFMDEFVYPNEARMVEDEGLPAELEAELQRRVKEMFYRAARAARIYDGPDEVHRQVVAQRILKTFPGGV